MVKADVAQGLYLHLGAHRTATSRFQMFLSLNRGRLQDLGVTALYTGRDGAKGGKLRLRLPEPRHFRSGDLEQFEIWAAEQRAKANADEAQGLLLSEENFPGNINLILSGKFYPQAQKRLSFLLQHWPYPVRRTLFCVRSYDAFFLSAYRKKQEFRAVRAFDKVIPNLMSIDRGWYDVLSDIHRATNAPIVVTTYETLPDPETLLHALCPGLPVSGWVSVPDRVNASLSASDLHVRQAALKQVQTARADTVTQGPEAAQWTDSSQIETLQTRYKTDLERIRSDERFMLV